MYGRGTDAECLLYGGSTFRSQLNPAFAPLRGYVNIPVLGGVQVNVSGNLSVSDIFIR